MAKKAAPAYPAVLETFRGFDGYERQRFTDSEPSCWNGDVRVVRYRITAEIIDEPKEVIAARLLKLWREADNMHHYEPLKRCAAKYGVDLPCDELGKDRK